MPICGMCLRLPMNFRTESHCSGAQLSREILREISRKSDISHPDTLQATRNPDTLAHSPGHFGTRPRTLRRQTLSESVWRRTCSFYE